jgi:heterodisulfide reductase subunit C
MEKLAETGLKLYVVDMDFLSIYARMVPSQNAAQGDAEVTETTATQKEPVKASEIDPKFKYELSRMHGGEKLLSCFQCGTCTSDCPVARFSDTYRPRTLIHMAQLGLKERVLNSPTLWLCAACFTCTDRCPQGVEVASVIRVLRNLAAEKGFVPQVFKDQAASILETGYAYKIPELRIKKRETLGLPPLPKGNLENIHKALKGVKFMENKGKEESQDDQ